ncbi:MAG TPA: class I SAM-dependent methyltransferase [Longimicrobiaceae bacterium]|nr:class I SAM-dependent methyltransferase [Longimicrobiaceae bacterium]
MTDLVDPPATASPPPRPRRAAGGAERVFLELLDRHLEGPLRLVVRGEPVTVGKGEGAGVAVRVHHDRFFARVLSGGNLGLGEAYMDGDWEMEEGDVAGFLTLLLRSRLDRRVKGDARTALKVLRVQLANLFRERHWEHARFHYDLGDEVYEATLDPVTMMYSCGYARTPDDTAEQLQLQKLDRICQKLEVRPGDRVLDIGCGFGGMLLHAARHYGATGVGITTSRRHCERGNRRIAEAGLADRVRLELRDHRTVEGRFDRVVSIGMMEHLPRKEYGRYFARIAAVLPPHGTGLVHAIGCNAERNLHDPFTQKYIFPGSGQPKLSEMAAGCERSGLAIRDVENLVRHYGPTAQRWLERFRAEQHRLDPAKYDARFRRMWEYYLSCAIAGSRASDAALYQVLFQKDYAAPMPLHRV